MRMGQGVRTGLGHGGITYVLQTQFSNFLLKFEFKSIGVKIRSRPPKYNHFFLLY